VIPIKTQVHSGHLTEGKKPTIEKVEDELNALGKEGWELASVQNIRLEDGKLYTVAYLKRLIR
jgi:hypothetical protein